MSKKSIRFMSILVILSLLTLSFVACRSAEKPIDNTDGGETQTEVPSSSEPSSSEEEDPYAKYAPIEGKEYTITLVSYQIGPIQENPPMIQYWNEKFGVNIEVWDIEWANWTETINLKIAAGEIPDRLQGRLNELSNYINQDVVAEVPEEVVKRYAPNYYKQSIKEEPKVFDLIRSVAGDGKLYGVPREFSFPGGFRNSLNYRGDWLEKIGYDKTPETLEEFEDVMYKFAHDDPNETGSKDTYGLSASGFNAVYGAFGFIKNYWQERDGKLVFASIQPEMKEALKLLNKWYKDGVLDPEFITGENIGGGAWLSHSFINERIGYTSHFGNYMWSEADIPFGAGHNVVELKKVNPDAAKSLKFGAPPIGPDGKRGIDQGNIFYGSLFLFGKHLEEEPDKIGKILEIYDYTSTTLENWMTAFYGLEGEHWDWKDDGTLEMHIDSNLSAIGAHTIITPTFAEIQRQTRQPLIDWYFDNNLDDGTGIQNKLIVSLPASSRYQAELTKIVDEAYISIITGDKPIDYFDEFVDRWYNNGGKQITEEANEWYSRMN